MMNGESVTHSVPYVGIELLWQLEIWKECCNLDEKSFDCEVSARNEKLRPYAEFGLTSICSLLQENKEPRNSQNILTIYNQSQNANSFHKSIFCF